MIHDIVNYIVDLVDGWGYIGIFVLMALESTLVPIPSEVVLIPAGYLVKQGRMDMFAALLAGTLGSLTGASFNYWLAVTFGRKFMLKYGPYVGLSEDKYCRIESWFLKHSCFGTFVGRLLFGVRHFISFPAGLARMPITKFAFYTSAGAAIWSLILLLLGYVLGDGDSAMEKAKLIAYWLLGVVLVMGFAYYSWCGSKQKSQQAE
jgi:membrane protein DedA with SNARE-associated domain